jgi:hypothetical protein
MTTIQNILPLPTYGIRGELDLSDEDDEFDPFDFSTIQ